MEILDIVQALAKTNSRLEKEQILMNAYMTGHRDFFQGTRLVCDTLISFGVKKVAEILDDGLDGDPTLTFEDFIALTDKLRSGELTGHAARDAINEAAASCDMNLWNQFYRKVLMKDLNIGVDAKTINKVLKKTSELDIDQYLIPVFGCQLAHNGDDVAHAKKIKGLKLLDIKCDGVRLLTVLDKTSGTITQYTRNGKVNENFPEIRESLRALLDLIPTSVVLDGEILSNSFKELMGQLNRKENVDTTGISLALFDIIPLDDFQKGICNIPQYKRHQTLSELEVSGFLSSTTNGLVWVIPKLKVDLDTPEGQETFNQFNKQALEMGREGIMIKNPNAPYEAKRSDAWLKKKPKIQVSLEIVGYQEGKPDTKYAGMLGAWLCSGEDEGKLIETNVGSGFTDDERELFWQDRDKYLGMIAEIEGDALTLGQDTEIYSIRFPTFKGFRGSVPGEKI